MKIDYERAAGVQREILKAVASGEIAVKSHTPQQALDRLVRRQEQKISACDRLAAVAVLYDHKCFSDAMVSMRDALLKGDTQVGASVLQEDIKTGSRLIALLEGETYLPVMETKGPEVGYYYRPALRTLVSRQIAQDICDLGVLNTPRNNAILPSGLGV